MTTDNTDTHGADEEGGREEGGEQQGVGKLEHHVHHQGNLGGGGLIALQNTYEGLEISGCGSYEYH